MIFVYFLYLQSQTNELWQRNCELEKRLQAKGEANDNLEKKYKEEVKTREEQVSVFLAYVNLSLLLGKDWKDHVNRIFNILNDLNKMVEVFLSFKFQLKCVQRELAIMLESSKDQAITCEQLTMQLRQTEGKRKKFTSNNIFYTNI